MVSHGIHRFRWVPFSYPSRTEANQNAGFWFCRAKNAAPRHFLNALTVLQEISYYFLYTKSSATQGFLLFPSTSVIAIPKSPLISTFTFSKNTKPRWLNLSSTICYNQNGGSICKNSAVLFHLGRFCDIIYSNQHIM